MLIKLSMSAVVAEIEQAAGLSEPSDTQSGCKHGHCSWFDSKEQSSKKDKAKHCLSTGLYRYSIDPAEDIDFTFV